MNRIATSAPLSILFGLFVAALAFLVPGAARAQTLCNPASGCTATQVNMTNQNPSLASPDTVLRNPHVYVVFWAWGCNPTSAPWACAADTQGEIPIIIDFLANIGGTRYLNVASQYNDPNGRVGNPVGIFSGSTSVDVWFDNVNTPPTGPTWQQAAMAAEATRARGIFGVNANPDALVVLALPPSYGGLPPPTVGCADHRSDASYFSPRPYIRFPYQAVCTGTTGCCYQSATFDRAVTQMLYHELAEALTDPRIDTGADQGWTAPGLAEISEKGCCSPIPLPITPTTDYYVPSLWSNAANNGTPGSQANSAFGRATRLDRFYTKSGQLYHDGVANTDAWVDAPEIIPNEPGGVNVVGDVAAISFQNNRVDAFAKDMGTNTLWHVYYPGSGSWVWEAFAPPTGCIMSGLDVTSVRPWSLDIVLTCTISGTARVWRKGYSPSTGWTSWTTPIASGNPVWPYASSVASGPAITSWGPGRLDLFVRTTSNQIAHASGASGTSMVWDPGLWSPPSGVTLVGDPDATSWGLGRLDMVVSDTAGLVHRFFYNGNTFSWAWDTPGGGAPTGYTLLPNPTIVALGDNRLLLTALSGTCSPKCIFTWTWDWSDKGWGGTTLPEPVYGIESSSW